jgi:hypothetical protein
MIYFYNGSSQFIVKYIYLADSEGAHTAISCNKTTFQTLELIVDLTSFANFKLIVNYILIPSFKEAQQDAPAQQATSSTILKLIDALFFEGATVDLISTKQDSQLIVEFILIPHSEGEMECKQLQTIPTS